MVGFVLVAAHARAGLLFAGLSKCQVIAALMYQINSATYHTVS